MMYCTDILLPTSIPLSNENFDVIRSSGKMMKQKEVKISEHPSN